MDIFCFLGLFREARCRRAHVKLAGDHVGDQTGAVFAEEGDVTVACGDRPFEIRSL